MEKYTLTVKEMAGQLGVSLPTAYEITEREDFPLIRIGRKKLIPVDGFKRWLDEQVGKKG